MNRRIHLATAIACGLVEFSIAQAQTSTTQFDLPKQPLADALRAVATRAGINVVFDPPVVAGRQAPALQGLITSREALDRLLMGTNLVYEFVSERTVAIKSASLKPPESKPSATAARPGDLRLAHAGALALGEEPASYPMPPDPSSRSLSVEGSEKLNLDEVVVTGTNIRGVAPVGVPLIVIDSEQIRRSGYSTTEQLLQSLPQNFTGGASASSLNFDPNLHGNNVSAGAGVNLRGLGPTATLTLLNGRRLPTSSDGYFVDVSAIPIDAIERVEVLTNGASAVYGADAVGGVVNFILKKGYEGARTDASYGFTSGGGRKEWRINQALGTDWGAGGVLLNVNYADQDQLDVSERHYTSHLTSPTTLFPANEQLNLLLATHQRFSEQWSAEFDAEYSDFERTQHWAIPPLHLFNGIGSANKTYSAGGAVRYELNSHWGISVEAGYGRSTNVYRYSIIDGTTGQTYIYCENCDRDIDFKSDIWNVTPKIEGTLAELNGGSLKLALGANYREERFKHRHDIVNMDSERRVYSLFAEAYAPLTESIKLSLAGRYDHYSDFGSTVNPLVGIEWQALSSLLAHASYGKSFRAPSSGTELASVSLGTEDLYLIGTPNPSGAGNVPTLVLNGSHQLAAERSKNWTAGLSFMPQSVPGLKLDATYYDIAYTNKILFPPYLLDPLLDPTVQTLVTQYSSPAELQSAIDAYVAAGANFFDYTFGEFGPDPLATAIFAYDRQQTNAAATRTSGVDFNADYPLVLGRNRLKFSLNATYINEFSTQYSASAPLQKMLNTYANPVDWRFRGIATWTRGRFDAALAANYTGDYTNTMILPTVPISSFLTFDTNFRYSLDEAAGLLRGAAFSMSVLNIFNREPPLARRDSFHGELNFDGVNASPLGRAFSLTMSHAW